MGTLHPKELLKEWTLEKLTVEMATGHSIWSIGKLTSRPSLREMNKIFPSKRTFVAAT
jgi:hypothetical protein